MQRRQFIAGFGSAAAWPLAARAQQDGRIRRVGVLMPSEEGDPYFRSGLSVLAQALTELGWTDGRNLRIDVRWAAGDVERARMLAKELVELQPDVLFVQAGAMVTSLQRETRTIPIVFANVADPAKNSGGQSRKHILSSLELAQKAQLSGPAQTINPPPPLSVLCSS
jgi:putative tryptophan/tyrosine transport system substrate-binding protein